MKSRAREVIIYEGLPRYFAVNLVHIQHFKFPLLFFQVCNQFAYHVRTLRGTNFYLSLKTRADKDLTITTLSNL